MCVHTTLAFTPERVPLGIIHQQTWVRPPQSPEEKSHKDKPIQDKESQKWLNSLTATEAAQKDSPHTLLIPKASIFFCLCLSQRTREL